MSIYEGQRDPFGWVRGKCPNGHPMDGAAKCPTCGADWNPRVGDATASANQPSVEQTSDMHTDVNPELGDGARLSSPKSARPAYCPECGSALSVTAKFCQGCGLSVPGATDASARSTTLSSTSSSDQTGRPSPTTPSPGWWQASDGRWYPPQHPNYAPPPVPRYTHPPQSSGTNGLAIASLVLGIVWVWGVGSILALIFGYTARRQIRDTGERQGGNGMAMAGIVLGWIGVAGLIFFIVAIVVAANAANPNPYGL